ncbi:MAG TPA: hypothetical protein VJI46_06065 [Candidatus Nanoarchaeia archaeon]|nr:hypothetical protein [Candidatus Nanoarchaeia archaeon]
MKSGVLFFVMLVILSASSLAVNVRLNEDFTLAQNETAELAGTSVKITLNSLEAPNCVSSFCVRKAILLIQQATLPDTEISLFEGDSREILKLPLFLDSSQLTFAGMKGDRALFIVQTLELILEKNSFLPREPVIVRARNTGTRPLVITEGGKCNPAYSIFKGENYLKLIPQRLCPPSIGRILLRENETKIIGTWDQKYYDKCKVLECDGDYVEQGDYYLFVNKIKKKISIYDPNDIYIVAKKITQKGTPITIAVQNMGNSIVEIETSPGCISGFKIKDSNGRQIILNQPGKCVSVSSVKLMPGHYQGLSVWEQLSYNHCEQADCAGNPVLEGTYTIELTTKDGKLIDKDIIISPAPEAPAEPEVVGIVEEKGFFARLWQLIFG